jgi:hypothetical protein
VGSVGVLTISRDASNPPAGEFTAGQKNAVYGKFKLENGTSNDTFVERLVISSSEVIDATEFLSNIRIYNGSTLLATAPSKMTPDSDYYGKYYRLEVPVSLKVPARSSVVLAIMADVLPNVATPPFNLGFRYMYLAKGGTPEIPMSGVPIYGNAMRIVGSVPSVEIPILNIPETAEGGSVVSVSWSYYNALYPKDWIALVPTGQSWSSIYPWFYTNGAKSGSGQLKLPSGVNSYDVVYYSNDSQTELGRSGPIRTTSNISLPILLREKSITASRSLAVNSNVINVSWYVPAPNPKDWIALVPRGAVWSPAYPWAYTNGTQEGSFNLMAPSGVTEVEAVYYLDNQSNELMRSSPVLVPGTVSSSNSVYSQMAATLLEAQAILDNFKNP